MRKLLTLLMLCIAAAANAQNAPTTHGTLPPPDYYVDSVKIPFAHINLISPDEINEISVNKKANAIYITLKDHKNLQTLLQGAKILSLNDITINTIAKADLKKPVLYVLDDKLLTDTAGVRIDAKLLQPVKVLKASETSYFKTTLPNALIIYIATKPAPIFIRGQATGK